MRTVIQRVSEARVDVDGATIGAIGRGLLVLIGVQSGDTVDDGEWLSRKIATLRIFPDDEGQMNRSVIDLAGEVLVVSQFTLIASTRKGTRPSFNEAARPDSAIPLYESFVHHLQIALGRPVQTGKFGAAMRVSLLNDGPVTLVIDSKIRE